MLIAVQSCSMSKIVVLSALLAFLLPSALGQCGGRLIGELPTLSNGVRGMFYAESETTFCIDQFYYDGLGPDVLPYFYYPGDTIDNTGGGVSVPSSQVQDRAYNNETLSIILPDKYRACDFEGFGLWCRYDNVLFTSITWMNAEVFSSDGQNDTVVCTSSPGRAFVGVLPTLLHDVGGRLYIRDNKTFVIRRFTYDGLGPEVFVYWFPVGAEATRQGVGGNIIPLPAPAGLEDEEGTFSNAVYTGDEGDFVITIPDNMDVFTCDVGNFSVWCRELSVFFTILPISTEYFTNNPAERAYRPDRIFCDRPSTRPGVLVGELPTTDPRAISGTFYVQDQYTFFIQLFSYSAGRAETYLYYYPVGTTPDGTGEGGTRISFSAESGAFPTGPSNSFFNTDFRVDLRLAVGRAVKTCDVGYFSIYDERVGEQVTTIAIPQSIFSEEEEEGKITCTASPMPATTMPPTADAVRLSVSLGVVLAIALLTLIFN